MNCKRLFRFFVPVAFSLVSANCAGSTFTFGSIPSTVSGRLAYTSNVDGIGNLYVTDLTWEHVLQLTGTHEDKYEGINHAPSWSPDGNRIVYQSNQDGDWDLYIVDLQGGNPKQITFNDSTDELPAWSPDGKTIAFSSDRANGFDQNIYIMGADGTGVFQVTDGDFDRDPSWSPDGTRLAYTAYVNGNIEIFAVDVNTGQTSQLTFNSVDDFSPSWSPDGQKIAFVSTVGGQWDIYVMDSGGLSIEQLTHTKKLDSDPTWSSDGQYIAYFSRGLFGNDDIYVIDVETKKEYHLLKSSSDEISPAWAP